MAALSRHKARENAFLAQFSKSFGHSTDEVVCDAKEQDVDFELDAFSEELLRLYDLHAAQVDLVIEGYLKGWALQRISRVNLAILRLFVAEILFSEQAIDSVIINEAVELAKRFGDAEDYQFINGVLGSVVRAKPCETEPTEV